METNSVKKNTLGERGFGEYKYVQGDKEQAGEYDE